MRRAIAVLLVLGCLSGSCKKSGASGEVPGPTTPTAATSTPTPPTIALTRLISLTGDLSFDPTIVGATENKTFTIHNDGTGVMTVTSIQGTNRLSSVIKLSWTNGTIAAGAVQDVVAAFTPLAATSYGGVVTAVADQSGGNNGINTTGIGVAPTYTVSGTVTDGTSNGILPNVTMTITSGGSVGKNTTTDNAGMYTLSGVSGGALTLAASNAGYTTVSKSITLSANTRTDFVLPRLASSSPAPDPTPSCSAGGGETAICKDGSLSFSMNRSGTCSSHGGVSCFVCPGLLCSN